MKTNMDSSQSPEKRVQTHETLKTIYFVVTGLSIVKALEVILEEFSKPIVINNAVVIFLAVSFFFTIVRFCQGVSRVLSDVRVYVIFDFYGFFLHAMAFYFMANNISNVEWFARWFLIMLLIDSTWLMYIFFRKKCTFTKVEKQWLHSNIVLSFLLVLLWNSSALTANDFGKILISLSLTIMSLIAAYFDWKKNKSYYQGKTDKNREPFIFRPYFRNTFRFIIKGK